MARRPNSRGPSGPLGAWVALLPEELATLKRNRTRGGMQNLENWYVDSTDPVTGLVWVDPVHMQRTQNYCLHYGPGGPNGRIRRALIPALRRIGIDLLPDWRAP